MNDSITLHAATQYAPLRGFDDKPITKWTISIEGGITERVSSDDARRLVEADAEKLADLLCAALPHATLARLTTRLMSRQTVDLLTPRRI